MSLEQELRDALHATTDHVRPDEASSLAAVGARGRAARRRRGVLVGSSVGALVLVGVTVAATRLGSDEQRIIVSEQPTTTGTALPTTTPVPTTVRSVAPTTAVAGSTAPTTTDAAATPGPATAAAPPTAVAFDRVVWPGPEHTVFDDGVSAARSFVDEFVGIADAPLGELRLEQPDIGAVDVYGRSESGAVRDVVVSTITVQRLDGHWYVTGAVADNVAIDAPLADAVVTSPVQVQGRGRGYEGTIVVQVRDAFQPAGEHLGQEVAVAGCCDELAPFDAAVSLSPPTGERGAIVATTDTGAEHGIVDFTVIPVRFAPSASATGDVMTVRLFLADAVDGADGELVEVQRTVPKTTGVLRASLVALLDGPTPDEVSAGLMSWFPSRGAVESVNLTDGRATVRLSLPLDELPDAAPVDEVLGQLNETVFQFDNVHVVRYELAGGCAAFDTWLHRGCEFTRDGAAAPAEFLCPEGGLDEVAALQAEVDAGHQPWRTSAPDVAAACTFGAPDATVEPAGADTFKVTQPSTGRTVIVTVAQPLRTGAGGVWVVTKVVPAS